MFKTVNLGRLTVGFDSTKKETGIYMFKGWWPPLWWGPYAVWFVPVPWVFACWQRDR